MIRLIHRVTDRAMAYEGGDLGLGSLLLLTRRDSELASWRYGHGLRRVRRGWLREGVCWLKEVLFIPGKGRQESLKGVKGALACVAQLGIVPCT